jgi:hypothetical protein
MQFACAIETSLMAGPNSETILSTTSLFQPVTSSVIWETFPTLRDKNFHSARVSSRTHFSCSESRFLLKDQTAIPTPDPIETKLKTVWTTVGSNHLSQDSGAPCGHCKKTGAREAVSSTNAAIARIWKLMGAHLVS